MTRNPDPIFDIFNISGDIIEIVKADASNYFELVEALKEVNVIFYLIHSWRVHQKRKEFSKKR
ncbi:MAG TPA: hypothetical protein VJ697_10790 [Nitrososphaeraceae archaeon]|nr:hypothetical protein [Nitrososphaeraceae archaeon]